MQADSILEVPGSSLIKPLVFTRYVSESISMPISILKLGSKETLVFEIK